MAETMQNLVEETVEETVDEMIEEQTENEAEDPLKAAIESQMKKIQRQSMLIGAQTSCTVILNKITVAMNKPGKRTMNDYKRIIKDIESFCRTGLSRKVNADGETEPIEEESVDNNSTKLMEETNESNIN